MRPLRKPVAIERVTRPPGPLPHYMQDWPAPDAKEDYEERAGIVADGCKLPQRSEAADRLAEAIVRNDWLTFPKEHDR